MLGQVRADEVGGGILDLLYEGRVEAREGKGAQQVSDERRVQHEALEGGIVREAHLDDGHGGCGGTQGSGGHSAEALKSSRQRTCPVGSTAIPIPDVVDDEVCPNCAKWPQQLPAAVLRTLEGSLSGGTATKPA